MNNKISVKCAEVVDFPCDILVLKFAQAFYGADAAVSRLLRNKISPPPGEYTIINSDAKLGATHTLFIGTVELRRFDYGQIREFAHRSIKIISQQMPNSRHVAMTMHGVGYGLDERESFLAQLAGLGDAFREGLFPSFLEQITIVERDANRAERLQQILVQNLPHKPSSGYKDIAVQSSLEPKIDAGIQSNSKPHVFVAMPFSEEMEDVYIFGIQAPINDAGFLCERIDMATFTGGILERIKSRIESAALVVADLTGANANVYLEVGYAWGKNRPTLLLSRNSDELKFDVKSQRCIIYKNIADLSKKLKADLDSIKNETIV